MLTGIRSSSLRSGAGFGRESVAQKAGKPVEGAEHEIEAEQAQQSQEERGAIGGIQTENLDRQRDQGAEMLVVEFGRLTLGDESADDRNDCDGDQCHEAELERSQCVKESGRFLFRWFGWHDEVCFLAEC